jgi:hypothetical protein
MTGRRLCRGGGRLLGAATCATALLLGAGHARAQQQDAAAAPAMDPRALGNHQKNVRLEIGARTQFVNSGGFDPFSTNDVLPQLSLGASFAFWKQDKLSLAAMAGFDYGGSEASLRSDRASLDVRRFTLAPEARYHVLRILAVTARVGPTLTREAAEVQGPLGTMLKTGWKFGFDATAGAALELWGYENGASAKPRLWLMGEGGYGWTAPMNLTFKPEDSSNVPQRLTALDLGELSLAGPLFRITAGVSFW